MNWEYTDCGHRERGTLYAGYCKKCKLYYSEGIRDRTDRICEKCGRQMYKSK